MQPSDEEVPDYLPDGRINIHGKLASKFTIVQGKDRSGKPHFSTRSEAPTTEQLLRRANEEMDKAYRNE